MKCHMTNRMYQILNKMQPGIWYTTLDLGTSRVYMSKMEKMGKVKREPNFNSRGVRNLETSSRFARVM